MRRSTRLHPTLGPCISVGGLGPQGYSWNWCIHPALQYIVDTFTEDVDTIGKGLYDPWIEQPLTCLAGKATPPGAQARASEQPAPAVAAPLEAAEGQVSSSTHLPSGPPRVQASS